MYKIYLLPGDLNDATDYYLNIIKKAILNLGQSIAVVNNVKEIDRDDVAITIHPKAFYSIWRQNKEQKIIHWFQGVMPEEAEMLFEKSILKKYPRKLFYTYLEKIILKHSMLVFFVSRAMHNHYKIKYRYFKDNYLIMPCFNQLLSDTSFSQERYLSPSFVYAGSMSKWQCIEETLEIFKKIKIKLATATLTLLTKEQEEAKRILKKYDLLDSTIIKYIPYTDLNNELALYKFGFIIRENDIVNNVATPTKMNSYLANGVIPIYSNYIYDFEENLNSYKYLIPFTNIDDCLIKLQRLNDVPALELYSEYQHIFNSYYHEDKYIKIITNKLMDFEFH